MTVDRPRAPEDWARMREICCLTAGEKVARDPSRWPFFGELWVGPYERLACDDAWVLRSSAGRVEGYLTLAPDTARFERGRRLSHWPALALGLARRAYPWNEDAKRFLLRALGVEKGPERRFPRPVARELARRYPAHLHINLSPEAQGRGLGAVLLEEGLARLAARGIPGVHLYCGPGPLRFYLAQGFHELERIQLPQGGGGSCAGQGAKHG